MHVWVARHMHAHTQWLKHKLTNFSSVYILEIAVWHITVDCAVLPGDASKGLLTEALKTTGVN